MEVAGATVFCIRGNLVIAKECGIVEILPNHCVVVSKGKIVAIADDCSRESLDTVLAQLSEVHGFDVIIDNIPRATLPVRADLV